MVSSVWFHKPVSNVYLCFLLLQNKHQKLLLCEMVVCVWVPVCMCVWPTCGTFFSQQKGTTLSKIYLFPSWEFLMFLFFQMDNFIFLIFWPFCCSSLYLSTANTGHQGMLYNYNKILKCHVEMYSSSTFKVFLITATLWYRLLVSVVDGSSVVCCSAYLFFLILWMHILSDCCRWGKQRNLPVMKRLCNKHSCQSFYHTH